MKTARATALAAAMLAAPAAADPVTYRIGEQKFEGFFVPADGEARGLVVIVHDWDGLDVYEETRAQMVAAMGYDAFALDLFGAGVRPETLDGRRAATSELYADRALMRERLRAGIEQAQALSSAEGTVVMGYCFGGAATMEAGRAGLGEGIVGLVSFHGGLATPEGQSWPQDAPPVLVLHGGADQNPDMNEVAAFAQELEAIGVQYDIQIYSGAPHAFTVFGSDRYRERADRQSWIAFTGFLREVFGESF